MVSKQSTNDLTLRSWSLLNVVLLVLSYSSGPEAVEMHEISYDKGTNEEGESFNEDSQSTTKPTGHPQYKKKANRGALKERLTTCRRRAQNSRVVRLLMTFAKVMFKFCATAYDIGSDFLQGKKSFFCHVLSSSY